MENEGRDHFSGKWLALRAILDADARDTRLGIAFLAAAQKHEHDHSHTMLTLLDLGAGDGSLLRWLVPLTPVAQHWFLAEKDSDLLSIIPERMAKWGQEQGWNLTGIPPRLKLDRGDAGGVVKVTLLQTDLSTQLAHLPWEECSGVMGSAFLDLVGARWLESLGDLLEYWKLPVWFSLSITGQDHWIPSHPDDSLIFRKIALDQRRDKGLGGPALGSEAPFFLINLLQKTGFQIQSSGSDWLCDAAVEGEALLLSRLIMLYDRVSRGGVVESTAITAWRIAREAQCHNQKLQVRIRHIDFLAVPSLSKILI